MQFSSHSTMNDGLWHRVGGSYVKKKTHFLNVSIIPSSAWKIHVLEVKYKISIILPIFASVRTDSRPEIAECSEIFQNSIPKVNDSCSSHKISGYFLWYYRIWSISIAAQVHILTLRVRKHERIQKNSLRLIMCSMVFGQTVKPILNYSIRSIQIFAKLKIMWSNEKDHFIFIQICTAKIYRFR